MNRRPRLLVIAAASALLLASTVTAAADVPPAGRDAGGGAAALAGWVVVIVASVAGFGCVAAILAALFPRVAAATDRQARASAPTTALLVGSLLALGLVALLAGLSHAGGHGAAVAFLLLGVPAMLLLLAGSLATVPLLGERLLGARGPSAAPLTRSVVGSLALGAALLPGLVFQLHAVAFLVAMAVFGWPLGVGLSALLAWRRARRAPAAAPAPEEPPRAP
ncbi:MAG: hypothetical protein U1E39_07360 [Planctomycetota bacterium]